MATVNHLISEHDFALVEEGKSITLHGVKVCMNREEGRHAVTYERVFQVGDTAEYDSYNLSYVGMIVAIGAKTVTIQPPYANEKKRRLKFKDFSWRNWNFNAEETARKNSEEMQHI